MRSFFAWIGGLALAASAAAQPVPPPVMPSGVLTLSASATVEVPKDWLTLVFSTTREGSDAQAVQQQLKQALDAALAEARRAARPQQLEASTGNFALNPRYGNLPNRSGAPQITGWQGSAELVVQGRDAAAIAQLAGRINTMTVARAGWSLSREAREKVESEAAAQAIARWRAKAALMAQQFGYAGWTVREVHVATDEPGHGPVPVVAMRARTMAASADEALPTEAGRGEVTATVNGSVQMQK